MIPKIPFSMNIFIRYLHFGQEFAGIFHFRFIYLSELNFDKRLMKISGNHKQLKEMSKMYLRKEKFLS